MVLMDVKRNCSSCTLSISCFFEPICFTSSDFLRFCLLLWQNLMIFLGEFDDFFHKSVVFADKSFCRIKKLALVF